jgi:3-hydroxymyristoyl/3-hydroxydecanoyl-(acyl carrier protein) dehydratase
MVKLMNANLHSLYISRKEIINNVCQEVDIDTNKQRAKAVLIVNKDHPFFFDHKLDHVPGLLIAEGMCQLSEILAKSINKTSTLFICGINIDFVKFCTFKKKIIMLAEVDSINQSSTIIYVKAYQNDQLRDVAVVIFCSKNKEYKHYKNIQGDDTVTKMPCPKNLINKTNIHNVMITTPEERGQAYYSKILKPSINNMLSDHVSGKYHPLYILEAFMQTQRYMNNLIKIEHENTRMRDILSSVDIALTYQNRQSDMLSLLVNKKTKIESEGTISKKIRTASIFFSKYEIGTCSIQTICFDKKKIA